MTPSFVEQLPAKSILDTVRECSLILDRQRHVRFANRAFLQTFRVAPSVIEGRHLYDLGGGEWDIPALRSRLEGMGEGDKIEGCRLELNVEGAGRRAFVLNARWIEDTSSILLTIEDVTDMVRAEQELQLAESDFRRTMMTTSEAVLMVDTAGRIVFANPKLEMMFGYPADGMLGLPLETLVPERLRELHAKRRETYMADPSLRTMGRDRELLGRRKDGSEFPIELVISPIRLLRETGLVAVTFITDVTLRKEAERQLRDYQDKLQQMAFDTVLVEERERRRIAVDVHDHIGQALALAQIKLASLREKMTGATRATVDETIELLAHSLADTRTLIFDLSPPILYELGLKEALSWLAEEFEKRHRLPIQLTDDGVEKPLDDATAGLVFRGVRELLTNVLKHAKAASARVSLQRAGDHVDIVVEDRGAGFDMNDVGRRPSSGGFGLFSVRERISRLGGTLEVESAPRQGTRVSMRVPLKRDNPTGHPTERGSS